MSTKRAVLCFTVIMAGAARADQVVSDFGLGDRAPGRSAPATPTCESLNACVDGSTRTGRAFDCGDAGAIWVELDRHCSEAAHCKTWMWGGGHTPYFFEIRAGGFAKQNWCGANASAGVKLSCYALRTGSGACLP